MIDQGKPMVNMTHPQLHIRRLVVLHALLGRDGIGAREHLHKRMALLGVDDARLHSSESLKDLAEVVPVRAMNVSGDTSTLAERNLRHAANEQCPAEN